LNFTGNDFCAVPKSSVPPKGGEMTQKQLSGTIDRFFSFIQAQGDGVDQAKTDLLGFFSNKKGSHIVHDQSVLYFYRDKKLLNTMDAKVSDSPP